ncbi:MAG: hypothetical protein AUJ07_00050 [Crenarchaeota archaeon 13_1_40CM_3_53_5]|nr:MAG: hypothetical protein AUJ07_00050 [Crenarchaeota archaeon 13_1_40CM_3_53_5]
MKALVVGCGKVGSEIVRDLAREKGVTSVTAADANLANLTALKPYAKVETVQATLAEKADLQKLMGEADIVCGALPGKIGFELIKTAIEAGRSIVDISYTAKDPFRLNKRARANNCTVVPQCGVAPGLSNMCVGDSLPKLDKVTKVRIYVGGLPQQPVPPLNYRLVFSLDDVVNEYTRPVHIIENGHQKIVEPLSGLGEMSFPGIGKLEYFLTDGLGTLTTSYPTIQEMQELTLRYPGHASIMNTLRTLGLFGTETIKVNNATVEPRKVTMELLRAAFSAGTPEDLLALRVQVEGTLRGRRVMIRYNLLDGYDKRHHVTAMARTTAYPCTSVALLVARGMVKEKGVVTPEKIAQDPALWGQILARLRTRGVNLTTQTTRPER